MQKSSLLKTEFTLLDIKARKTTAESNEVTIRRHRDEASTDSFKLTTELDNEENANPEPVNGKLEQAVRKLEIDIEEPTILLEDGRAGLEVVIGPDNRERITTTQAWPWRIHGHVEMRFPNGKRYIGSGTMVGRHHALTAGHVIYSASDGGWATSVAFQAARNDTSLPFGSVNATQLLSVSGWTINRDSRYDMGMLILENDLGTTTGWAGIITGPDNMLSRHKVNVSGYPGDKGGRQLWTMADSIKGVQAERLTYNIDTAGGQSGCGVWSTWAGHQGEKVCSIHTTGSQSGNGSTRISRPKFDRIVDWFSRF